MTKYIERDLTRFLPPSEDPLEKSIAKVKKTVGKYIDTVASDIDSDKSVNVKIFDFLEFNQKLNMPEFGEYSFNVEQKFLREATKILGLSANTVGGVVGITLFKERMKLSLYNQKFFSEIFIPITINEKLDELGKNSGLGVSFSFNQEVLNKISAKFIDTTITFKLNIEKNILAVCSGNTKLELDTPHQYPAIDYHLKLIDPKYLCKVDVDIFRDAIKYVSYFVQKNEVKKNLSQSDCQNSMLYGGSFSSVGIYKSKALQDMKINIRFECLNYLYKILPYFNKYETHIFETENYYLIRDNKLFFGFEKSRYNFPPVDKFLNANLSKNAIILSRRNLLRSLDKLSIVVSGEKPLIKLRVCDGNKLKLFVKDASGKVSMDVLDIISKEKLPDLSFIIEFNTLMKVVPHFDFDNVNMRYLLNKVLVIEDDTIASSNFSLFMEEDLNKL